MVKRLQPGDEDRWFSLHGPSHRAVPSVFQQVLSYAASRLNILIVTFISNKKADAANTLNQRQEKQHILSLI